MTLLGLKTKSPVQKTDKLEVAMPLYVLPALKQQNSAYNRLFEKLYPIIGMKNPLLGINPEESVDALIAIEKLSSAISFQESCKVSSLKESLNKEWDNAFETLTDAYKRLPNVKAREFVNKPLSFIRNYSEDSQLTGFINAANSLPLQQGSELLYYSNWFLAGEKLKQEIGSLTAIINKAAKKDKSIAQLKEELNSQSSDYQSELVRGIKEESILALLSEFRVSEGFDLVKIAHALAKTGSLILPKPETVTEHTAKDLDDLIEFQFSDPNSYLIEEASNSRDANASWIRYKFFEEGIVIEDNGDGMGKEQFFKEYPLSYISIKKNRFSIGRFGAGSKAKLVEVLKNKGEAYVEAKAAGEEALAQRYFMHDSMLHIGFRHSDLKHNGLRITVSSKSNKEKEKGQEKLIKEKLQYFNPGRIKVIASGKNINKKSILRKRGSIDVFSVNDEESRVHFNPKKEGGLIYLSGEVLISRINAPFYAVIDVPLQFQPVEGRNDFVYSERLCHYISEVFSKAFLPKLEKLQKKKCIEWFASNSNNRNPCNHFMQAGSREDILRLYRCMYPQKSIASNSRIVAVKGKIEKLNSIVQEDIFVNMANVAHSITAEEYASLCQNPEASEAVRQAISTGSSSFTISEEGKIGRKGHEVAEVFYKGITADNPFYFSRPDSMLLINTSHKAFSIDQEERQNFYLSEMMRIAGNG
ncbi:MAG: ATP-binding protein [Candidatus Woesearchaeota archaeon]